jgi:hypothetical protein
MHVPAFGMTTMQPQPPDDLQQDAWYTGMHAFVHCDWTHEPDPPLLLLPPLLPVEAAHEPPWHVWLFVVQSKHVCPLDPHKVLTIPDWQLLFESQQPLHAPELQETDPLLLPESSPPDPPLDELLLLPESSPITGPPLDELVLLEPPDDELLLPPESSAPVPESPPPGGSTPPSSKGGGSVTFSPAAHPARTRERQTPRSPKGICTPSIRCAFRAKLTQL